MESCASCKASIPRDSLFCPGCGAPTSGVSDELLASAASDPTGLLDRLRRATRGEFTVIRELGRGGMGRVFLAREAALDRRVAIKVLPPHLAELPDVAQRFRREARIAGKLSHPNIMPIHQVLELDSLHFFTMPFVPGPSLRQVLRHRPRLDVKTCRRYLVEAADALYYAHAQGVIHRDIKPENMLLEGGPGGRLLLTDFGIAKAVGAATTTLTRPGELMGTPYYMSPEVCNDSERVDGRSDQYSLGLVGYEMLAGRFPLTADSLAGIVYKHVHEYPEPLGALRRDVPEGMRRAIERAIRKDPAERFPSMAEMKGALAFETQRPPARLVLRRRWVGALLASIVTAALAGGSLLLLQRDGAKGGSADTAHFPDEPARGPTVADSSAGANSIPEPTVAEPVGPGERALASERQDASRQGPSVGESLDYPLAGRETAGSKGAPALTRDAGTDEEPADSTVGPSPAEAVTEPRPDVRIDPPDAAGDSGPVEEEGFEAGAEPESVSPSEAVATLLESYRQAIEAEDGARLTEEVYRAPIPAPDARIFDHWFGAGESFEVDLEIERIDTAGDSAVARITQRMRYRLQSTGEPRVFTTDLLLRFRGADDGWRLERLERPER